MKNIFYTVLMALLVSPFLSTAQVNCFTNTESVSEFEVNINASVDCALPVYGGGCQTGTSEPTTLSFHPVGDVAIECEMWCADDGFDFSAANQNDIFASAMDLANANAPKCVATGEEMIVIDINFYIDLCVCGGASQLFLAMDVTYACCERANDCQADFIVNYDPTIGECIFTVTNTSTPSSDNDCGGCNNPTGFTDASWHISTIQQNGGLQWINPYTSGSGFNFQFAPTSLKYLVGYRICLTTTDCNGCVAEVCESIRGDFSCFGFTGNDDKLRARQVETSTRPLEISPNPTNGFTNMNVSEKEFDQNNSRIEIYDLQGRMVDQLNTLSAGANLIDLSRLSSSVYIVKLVIDGQVLQAEKIVVE